MTNKPRDIKPFLAGILVLITVGVFLKMGFWQLERLVWKQGLIASIEAQKAVDATTVPLSTKVDSVVYNLNRGYLTGVWLADKNVKVGPQLMDGVIGYWIVSPFMLNDGTAVFVNRGWVPENMTVMMVDSAPPKGIVTITGALRTSDIDGEMVADDPKSWRALNIDAIANTLRVPNFAPLALFMETSNPPDDSTLRPAPALTNMRNEHKNYAIFWFGMAILTVVLFVLAVVVPNLPKKR